MSTTLHQSKIHLSRRKFALALALARTLALTSIALCACLPFLFIQEMKAQNKPTKTRYLLFQIFTYSGAPEAFPPSPAIESTALDIKAHIQMTGDRRNKLGICLGPLTLRQSDEEIKNMIISSFDLAVKNDIAIAFHIDDQMFYDGRKDLSAQQNIEWTDWSGTPSSGRRLDWSARPIKAAPPLCLNSPAVQAAAIARGHLIGQEIRKCVDRLKAVGKEFLYAGTIVGWESMIGADYATNKHTGYHALKNRGFSATRAPANLDAELTQVVKDFVNLWAQSLVEAGAPKDKIYCHIAFTPQGLTAPGKDPVESMGYATADTAFSKWYLPGFTLYPAEDTLAQVWAVIHKHGDPDWIMSEGTNVVPNGMPGESKMESYLAKLFNHGAVAANIFSWGMGGEAERERNLFRRATENSEALDAYRKFLSGQPLQEQQSNGPSAGDRLREKIAKIQKQLPVWINGRPERVDTAKQLMQYLDKAVKSNSYQQTDAAADEVLRRLSQ